MKFTLKLLVVALFTTLYGCGGDDTINSSFIIKPYLESAKGTAESIDKDIVGYYFYADTSKYSVGDYEQSLKGQIFGVGNVAKNYDGKADVDELTGVISFNDLTEEKVLLVLCDTTRVLYMWRQLILIGGLDKILTNIRFRPWRPDTTYNESSWTIVNPNPPKPPVPDPDPTPDPDPDPTPDPDPDPTPGS